MKTRIVTVILIFSLPLHFIFAQVDGLSLEDYKYPDLRRTTLIGDFGFDNDLDFNTADQLSSTAIKNKAFVGLFTQVNYLLTTNNRKWQSGLFVRQSNNLSGNRNKNEMDSIASTNNNAHNLFIDADYRRYFSQNFFVEATPNAGVIFSRSKINGFGQDRLSKTLNYDIGTDLGVGKGRLEFVSDVHQALFTLEDLENEGILKRPVNAEDVKMISDRIAQLKNDRFFDSRHKRIFQFTQLDSLLNSLGLIAGGDAASTAILYDNWLFAFRPIRFAGARFSIGLTESMAFSKTQITNTGVQTDTETRRTNFGLYAEYRYERPVNLYWQHAINLRAQWSRNTTNDLILDQETLNIDRASTKLSYALSYFPSTRTSFETGAVISGYYDKLNGELVPDVPFKDELNYAIALYFDTGYYVSPQFRINAGYNLGFASRSANSNIGFSEVPGQAFDTGVFSHLTFGIDYFFW